MSGRASLPRRLGAAALFARGLAIAGASIATVASAAWAAPCAPGTVLTLIGADTNAGRILLALPDPSGRPADLVEVEVGDGPASARVARIVPGAARGVSSGSTGPGAVITLAVCGANCLQARIWRDRGWVLLGEPLAAPERALSHAAYDRAGTPWLVLHEPGGLPGFVTASAFRLKGLDWEARGRLRVSDTGTQGAVPVPDLEDGVVSGTGLFTTSGKPGYWLQGLPEVETRGEVTPLGGPAAVYLDGAGRIYFTADRGGTWKRSTWNPWGGGLSPAFQHGTDWNVETAAGGRRSPLALVWFDRRVPSEPALVLTTAGAQASFREVARVPADATEEAAHVVASSNGAAWWLLGGTCSAAGGSSAVTLRVVEGGKRAEVVRVPITQ